MVPNGWVRISSGFATWKCHAILVVTCYCPWFTPAETQATPGPCGSCRCRPCGGIHSKSSTSNSAEVEVHGFLFWSSKFQSRSTNQPFPVFDQPVSWTQETDEVFPKYQEFDGNWGCSSSDCDDFRNSYGGGTDMHRLRGTHLCGGMRHQGKDWNGWIFLVSLFGCIW